MTRGGSWRRGGLVVLGLTLLACANVLGIEEGQHDPAAGGEAGAPTGNGGSRGGAGGTGGTAGAGAMMSSNGGGGGGGSGGGSALSACSAPVPTSYFEAVVADVPVGYWPLDDASAPIQNVSDAMLSGTLLNGEGMLQSPGQVGTALLLDVNDAVDTQTNLADPSVPFAVEAWIFLESQAFNTIEHPNVDPDDRPRTILSDIDSGSGSPQGVTFDVDASGHLRFVSNGSSAVTTDDPLPASTFVHVVATYDGSGGVILYVNGEVAKPGSVADPGKLNGADIFIGADFNGQRRFFDGRIDEVAVYADELSATRIRCHYQAGIVFGG